MTDSSSSWNEEEEENKLIAAAPDSVLFGIFTASYANGVTIVFWIYRPKSSTVDVVTCLF